MEPQRHLTRGEGVGQALAEALLSALDPPGAAAAPGATARGEVDDVGHAPSISPGGAVPTRRPDTPRRTPVMQPSRRGAPSPRVRTSFEIAEQTYLYDTIFGDPAFDGAGMSDYARLVLSVSIERTKLLSFLKVVTGVYVSVALSTLAFLLGPYNGRRRTNLLVGTLFAVLVKRPRLLLRHVVPAR